MKAILNARFIQSGLIVLTCFAGLIVVAPNYARADRAIYDISMQNGEWHAADPSQKRITTANEVVIRVHDFNFLQYSLTVNIDEKEVESYQYLEKLWASILVPGAGSLFDLLKQMNAVPGEAKEDTLVSMCRTVYQKSADLDLEITYYRSKISGTEISPAEHATLDSSLTTINTRLRDVNLAYEQLQLRIRKDFPKAFGALKGYVDVAEQAYKGVAPKARVYLSMAKKSMEPYEKSLGKRDSGKFVRVTIKRVDEAGQDSTMCEFTYLVQSRWPLVAHAGLLGSSLDDVQFEKVQRVSSAGPEDFFQQTTDESWTADAALFLGWPVYAHISRHDVDLKDEWGLLVSLGTSLSKPGERIMVGPSLYWNRLVVTAGGVLAKKAEAKPEDTNSIPPDVFRIVTEDLVVEGFLALSIRLY